jgi:hypothetical protein
VITTVPVLVAARSLLFHVGNLAVRRDFPVVAGDAAAAERRETKETNQTHHADPHPGIEQFLYRRGTCGGCAISHADRRGDRRFSENFQSSRHVESAAGNHQTADRLAG